jgi:ATP-binding cassette subfamily B protein
MAISFSLLLPNFRRRLRYSPESQLKIHYRCRHRSQNYNLLVLILSLLAVGAILYAGIGLFANFLGARLGVLIVNNIRRSVFEHLQNLSMEFFGRRSAADIVKCVMSDTQHVEYGLITTGLSVVILEIGSILFSAIFLFFLNWQLAVISCIGLTFCTIAPAKIAQQATEWSYQLMEKEGQIGSESKRIFSRNRLLRYLGWKPKWSRILIPI